jgi:hypothetical protein
MSWTLSTSLRSTQPNWPKRKSPSESAVDNNYGRKERPYYLLMSLIAYASRCWTLL